MPWFKVDDSLHSHPKWDDVSLAAAGLWMMAGSYASHYLTDGEISHRRVLRLGGTEELAAELVDAGLWLETDTGYRFHDWHDYQPSRNEVEDKREREREQSRERMRRMRERKAANSDAEPVTGDAPVTPVTPTPCDAPVTSLPTRPDPTQKSEARKRATPPPPTFPITDDMRTWAAENAPGVNLEAETQKLLDYARANGKSYKDWLAAWRNWIRRSRQYQPAGDKPTRIPPRFDPAAHRPDDAVPMPENVRQLIKGANA